MNVEFNDFFERNSIFNIVEYIREKHRETYIRDPNADIDFEDFKAEIEKIGNKNELNDNEYVFCIPSFLDPNNLCFVSEFLEREILEISVISFMLDTAYFIHDISLSYKIFSKCLSCIEKIITENKDTKLLGSINLLMFTKFAQLHGSSEGIEKIINRVIRYINENFDMDNIPYGVMNIYICFLLYMIIISSSTGGNFVSENLLKNSGASSLFFLPVLCSMKENLSLYVERGIKIDEFLTFFFRNLSFQTHYDNFTHDVYGFCNSVYSVVKKEECSREFLIVYISNLFRVGLTNKDALNDFIEFAKMIIQISDENGKDYDLFLSLISSEINRCINKVEEFHVLKVRERETQSFESLLVPLSKSDSRFQLLDTDLDIVTEFPVKYKDKDKIDEKILLSKNKFNLLYANIKGICLLLGSLLSSLLRIKLSNNTAEYCYKSRDRFIRFHIQYFDLIISMFHTKSCLDYMLRINNSNEKINFTLEDFFMLSFHIPVYLVELVSSEISKCFVRNILNGKISIIFMDYLNRCLPFLSRAFYTHISLLNQIVNFLFFHSVEKMLYILDLSFKNVMRYSNLVLFTLKLVFIDYRGDRSMSNLSKKYFSLNAKTIAQFITTNINQITNQKIVLRLLQHIYGMSNLLNIPLSVQKSSGYCLNSLSPDSSGEVVPLIGSLFNNDFDINVLCKILLNSLKSKSTRIIKETCTFISEILPTYLDFTKEELTPKLVDLVRELSFDIGMLSPDILNCFQSKFIYLIPCLFSQKNVKCAQTFNIDGIEINIVDFIEELEILSENQNYDLFNKLMLLERLINYPILSSLEGNNFTTFFSLFEALFRLQRYDFIRTIVEQIINNLYGTHIQMFCDGLSCSILCSLIIISSHSQSRLSQLAFEHANSFLHTARSTRYDPSVFSNLFYRIVCNFESSNYDMSLFYLVTLFSKYCVDILNSSIIKKALISDIPKKILKDEADRFISQIVHNYLAQNIPKQNLSIFVSDIFELMNIPRYSNREGLIDGLARSNILQTPVVALQVRLRNPDVFLNAQQLNYVFEVDKAFQFNQAENIESFIPRIISAKICDYDETEALLLKLSVLFQYARSKTGVRIFNSKGKDNEGVLNFISRCMSSSIKKVRYRARELLLFLVDEYKSQEATVKFEQFVTGFKHVFVPFQSKNEYLVFYKSLVDAFPARIPKEVVGYVFPFIEQYCMESKSFRLNNLGSFIVLLKIITNRRFLSRCDITKSILHDENGNNNFFVFTNSFLLLFELIELELKRVFVKYISKFLSHFAELLYSILSEISTNSENNIFRFISFVIENDRKCYLLISFGDVLVHNSGDESTFLSIVSILFLNERFKSVNLDSLLKKTLSYIVDRKTYDEHVIMNVSDYFISRCDFSSLRTLFLYLTNYNIFPDIHSNIALYLMKNGAQYVYDSISPCISIKKMKNEDQVILLLKNLFNQCQGGNSPKLFEVETVFKSFCELKIKDFDLLYKSITNMLLCSNNTLSHILLKMMNVLHSYAQIQEIIFITALQFLLNINIMNNECIIDLLCTFINNNVSQIRSNQNLVTRYLVLFSKDCFCSCKQIGLYLMLLNRCVYLQLLLPFDVMVMIVKVSKRIGTVSVDEFTLYIREVSKFTLHWKGHNSLVEDLVITIYNYVQTRFLNEASFPIKDLENIWIYLSDIILTLDFPCMDLKRTIVDDVLKMNLSPSLFPLFVSCVKTIKDEEFSKYLRHMETAINICFEHFFQYQTYVVNFLEFLVLHSSESYSNWRFIVIIYSKLISENDTPNEAKFLVAQYLMLFNFDNCDVKINKFELLSQFWESLLNKNLNYQEKFLMGTFVLSLLSVFDDNDERISIINWVLKESINDASFANTLIFSLNNIVVKNCIPEEVIDHIISELTYCEHFSITQNVFECIDKILESNSCILNKKNAVVLLTMIASSGQEHSFLRCSSLINEILPKSVKDRLIFYLTVCPLSLWNDKRLVPILSLCIDPGSLIWSQFSLFSTSFKSYCKSLALQVFSALPDDEKTDKLLVDLLVHLLQDKIKSHTLIDILLSYFFDRNSSVGIPLLYAAARQVSRLEYITYFNDYPEVINPQLLFEPYISDDLFTSFSVVEDPELIEPIILTLFCEFNTANIAFSDKKCLSPLSRSCLEAISKYSNCSDELNIFTPFVMSIDDRRVPKLIDGICKPELSQTDLNSFVTLLNQKFIQSSKNSRIDNEVLVAAQLFLDIYNTKTSADHLQAKSYVYERFLNPCLSRIINMIQSEANIAFNRKILHSNSSETPIISFDTKMRMIFQNFVGYNNYNHILVSQSQLQKFISGISSNFLRSVYSFNEWVLFGQVLFNIYLMQDERSLITSILGIYSKVINNPNIPPVQRKNIQNRVLFIMFCNTQYSNYDENVLHNLFSNPHIWRNYIQSFAALCQNEVLRKSIYHCVFEYYNICYPILHLYNTHGLFSRLFVTYKTRYLSNLSGFVDCFGQYLKLDFTEISVYQMLTKLVCDYRSGVISDQDVRIGISTFPQEVQTALNDLLVGSENDRAATVSKLIFYQQTLQQLEKVKILSAELTKYTPINDWLEFSDVILFTTEISLISEKTVSIMLQCTDNKKKSLIITGTDKPMFSGLVSEILSTFSLILHQSYTSCSKFLYFPTFKFYTIDNATAIAVTPGNTQTFDSIRRYYNSATEKDKPQNNMLLSYITKERSKKDYTLCRDKFIRSYSSVSVIRTMLRLSPPSLSDMVLVEDQNTIFPCGGILNPHKNEESHASFNISSSIIELFGKNWISRLSFHFANAFHVFSSQLEATRTALELYSISTLQEFTIPKVYEHRSNLEQSYLQFAPQLCDYDQKPVGGWYAKITALIESALNGPEPRYSWF